MSQTSTLAIEASGLKKSFGTSRAICGVDLAVRRGSVYGILGPNGAGKTTTKTLVGSGVLHVRLRDADRRADAADILGRTLAADVHLEPDTAALSAPGAEADAAAEALGELSRRGIAVAAFSLGQPTLDEVFLALTGHRAQPDQATDAGTAIERKAA